MEPLDREEAPRPRRGICRDGPHGASHGGEDEMEVLRQLEMVLAYCQTTYLPFLQSILEEMDLVNQVMIGLMK